MSVSSVKGGSLALPWPLGGVIAAAGMVSLLATYWDDVWHTDLGRDSATIPPHLLLYGSVAVAGVGVVGWGLLALVRTRSVWAVLRYGPLLLAGLGGALTLAAAPVDAMWHTAYGRDAVLWSPPHMLVVFASTAMITGVLIGVRASPGGSVETATAVVLLGSVSASVLEYETDVPQFGQVWYLPVLLVAALFAAAVARGLVPSRAPVTTVVAGYVALRLVAVGALTLLGRSTPDLPVAVLGLVLVDLPWRSTLARYAAGAAGVSALAWLGAGTRLISQPPGAVARAALPVIVVAVLIVAATGRLPRRTALTGVAMALGVGLGTVPVRPAAAHDPGQGQDVLAVSLTGSSDGNGRLTLTAAPADCAALAPVALIARRAGRQVAGQVHREGCVYRGVVAVPEGGRWFVYLQAGRGEENLETWLPLDARRAGTLTQARTLYRPADAGTSRDTEIASGVLIYAVGLSLLVLAAWQARRSALARRRTLPAIPRS